MDSLQTAKDVNNYISGYIKLADAKVAGFVAITTAISGFLIPNFYRWLAERPIDFLLYIFWFLFVLSGVALLGVLFFGLCALSPKSETANSIVSFPDIARMKAEEYEKAFLSLDEKGLIKEYLRHNVTLSKRAIEKFKWLGWATCFFKIWIGMSLCLYILYALTAI